MRETKNLAFLAGLFLGLGQVENAQAATPIAFKPEADWKGYANRYPTGAPSQLFQPDGSLPRVLLVRQIATNPMSEDKLAHHAYDVVFEPQLVKRLPPGASYVVVVIYSPTTPSGAVPLSAFVFSLNKDHKWQNRYVTSEQLSKVQEVLGNRPL